MADTSCLRSRHVQAQAMTSAKAKTRDVGERGQGKNTMPRPSFDIWGVLLVLLTNAAAVFLHNRAVASAGRMDDSASLPTFRLSKEIMGVWAAGIWLVITAALENSHWYAVNRPAMLGVGHAFSAAYNAWMIHREPQQASYDTLLRCILPCFISAMAHATSTFHMSSRLAAQVLVFGMVLTISEDYTAALVNFLVVVATSLAAGLLVCHSQGEVFGLDALERELLYGEVDCSAHRLAKKLAALEVRQNITSKVKQVQKGSQSEDENQEGICAVELASCGAALESSHVLGCEHRDVHLEAGGTSASLTHSPMAEAPKRLLLPKPQVEGKERVVMDSGSLGGMQLLQSKGLSICPPKEKVCQVALWQPFCQSSGALMAGGAQTSSTRRKALAGSVTDGVQSTSDYVHKGEADYLVADSQLGAHALAREEEAAVLLEGEGSFGPHGSGSPSALSPCDQATTSQAQFDIQMGRLGCEWSLLHGGSWEAVSRKSSSDDVSLDTLSEKAVCAIQAAHASVLVAEEAAHAKRAAEEAARTAVALGQAETQLAMLRSQEARAAVDLATANVRRAAEAAATMSLQRLNGAMALELLKVAATSRALEEEVAQGCFELTRCLFRKAALAAEVAATGLPPRVTGGAPSGQPIQGPLQCFQAVLYRHPGGLAGEVTDGLHVATFEPEAQARSEAGAIGGVQDTARASASASASAGLVAENRIDLPAHDVRRSSCGRAQGQSGQLPRPSGSKQAWKDARRRLSSLRVRVRVPEFEMGTLTARQRSLEASIRFELLTSSRVPQELYLQADKEMEALGYPGAVARWEQQQGMEQEAALAALQRHPQMSERDMLALVQTCIYARLKLASLSIVAARREPWLVLERRHGQPGLLCGPRLQGSELLTPVITAGAGGGASVNACGQAGMGVSTCQARVSGGVLVQDSHGGGCVEGHGSSKPRSAWVAQHVCLARLVERAAEAVNPALGLQQERALMAAARDMDNVEAQLRNNVGELHQVIRHWLQHGCCPTDLNPCSGPGAVIVNLGEKTEELVLQATNRHLQLFEFCRITLAPNQLASLLLVLAEYCQQFQHVGSFWEVYTRAAVAVD
eukprot:jgi/Mesen1/7465/ME000039S06683